MRGPARVERVRAALEVAGVDAVHLCPHHVLYGLNPACAEPDEQADAADHLLALARLATELGIPTVHVQPGWSVVGEARAAARARAVQAFDVLLGSKPPGVRLLIEPLEPGLTDLASTPAQARRFVEDVDGEMGILVDTLQSARAGLGQREALEGAGDLLEAVHVADTDRLPPGEGTLDLRETFDTLDDLGFDGLVSVEVWGDDAASLARRSREGLDALL